jgi:hypothetical protein
LRSRSKARSTAPCIHPYGEGGDPEGHPIAAINLRCLDGIELDKVPVLRFDGRSA